MILMNITILPDQMIFFVDILYKKFDASTWPIMDSGLLGPITLTTVKQINS